MKTAIVDDDPIVCQSLATILAATGAAEVLWTANNETDAVERYRSGRTTGRTCCCSISRCPA